MQNHAFLSSPLKLYLMIGLFLFPVELLAKDSSLIEWQSTNIQILRGVEYEVGSKKRTLATLEHANKWKYGDFHFFLDQTWNDDGKPFYYFEPTTRVSLSKIIGTSLSTGLIKDVLISSNFEKPKGSDIRFLYGASVDLALSGFNFFKTNYWVRDNPDLSGKTYQVTLAWNRPISYKNLNFLIEGFADFAGSEGVTSAHQLIVPRFLFDVGHFNGLPKNKLWAGIEYSYWHNKFGNRGQTESNPQLQIKWVF